MRKEKVAFSRVDSTGPKIDRVASKNKSVRDLTKIMIKLTFQRQPGNKKKQYDQQRRIFPFNCNTSVSSNINYILLWMNNISINNIVRRDCCHILLYG